MKISVITPTFNSEQYIRQNCQSILSQTYKNFEHLVVDNQSSDATLEIVQAEYSNCKAAGKARLFFEQDNGIADAFNKGIALSTGEIIAFLNSDDYYFNADVFQNVIDAFSNDELLFVYGDIFFLDEKYGSNIRKPLLCSLQKGMPFNHPAMFMKKICFEQAGVFDTTFRFAMDFELISRMAGNIPNFMERGFYLSGSPLVFMRAAGASWLREKESVIEVKHALQKNKLWNLSALYFYLMRRMRILLKAFFEKTGLLFTVKLWRNLKWK
ncbi:MAG: glycosyltransferase family 2 protein [Ignavibacteriaceae bacterium]